MERLLSLRRNVPAAKCNSSPEKKTPTLKTPPRFTDFKKKGNGIDKRTMRIHRRSIDQRKNRDTALLKHRTGLDKLSPLKEVQNSQQHQPGGKKTKQSQKSNQVQEMKDRLKKWKEEKELKKKLERQKKQPMFKVRHIEVEKVPFAGLQGKTQPKNTRTRANSNQDSKITVTTASKTQPMTTRTRANSNRDSKTTVTMASKPTTRSTRSSARVANNKTAKAASSAKSQPSGRQVKLTQKKQQPQPSQRSTRSSSRSQTSTKSTVTSQVKPKQQPKKTRSTSRSRNNTKSTDSEVNIDNGSNAQLSSGASSSVSSGASSSASSGASSSASSGEESATEAATLQTPVEEDMVAESSGEESAKEPTTLFQQAVQKNHGDFNFKLPYLSDVASSSSGEDNAVVEAAPVEDMVAESSGEENAENLPTDTGVFIQDAPEEKQDALAMFEFRLPISSTASSSEESSDETPPPVVAPQEHPIIEESIKNDEGLVEDALPQIESSSPQEEIPSTSIDASDATENPSEDMVVESAVVPQTLPNSPEEPTSAIPEVQDNYKVSTSGDEDKEAVVVAAPEKVEETKAAVVKDEDKDVPYFRQLVRIQTARLTKMCEKWQDIVQGSPDLNEDASGEIRTTIGKAQLLMDQRFKQFIGLVDNCEFNLGELKTHCTDLIGFWEMVAYQVEDIDRMFVDLDKLQANNWVKEVAAITKPKKLITKKLKKKPKQTEASKKAAAERIAARQRLIAARNAMKAKQTRSKDTEKVVFDAGFFKVESPLKSPKINCQAGSPLSAAFLRRTSRTPGSNHSTPRAQAFKPTNPRLSLCGTLSNLVLSESPVPSGVTTRSRHGTPASTVKVNARSSPQFAEAKPTTPSRVKLGMPFGIRPSMQFTPRPGCSPYATRMTPSKSPESQFVPKPNTPLSTMTTSPPLAAKPCTPLVAKVTPLREAGSTPAGARAKTPMSRKRRSPRNESTHLLVPGIGSPNIRDNLLIPGIGSPSVTVREKTCNASIFTPPPKMTPSRSSTMADSSNTVSDLICLDSPLIPTSVAPKMTTPPPTTTNSSGVLGSLQCFAAINSTPDMRDLLGTDVIMSPVRRSGRLRQTSGTPAAQVVVDTLASMPDDVDYGYQPNVSLL